MRFLKNNQGFTLVELIVTIVVGSIAAAAAATVLILGLRIYNNGNETALKQNEVNIGITVIEQLVSEAEVKVKDNVVTDADGNTLVKCENHSVIVNAVPILENVTAFAVEPDLDADLLEFFVEINKEDQYHFSVYCRLGVNETEPDTGENLTVFSIPRPVDTAAVLSAAVEDEALTLNVRTFLNVLSSQRGSTGRVQTPDGEGEYYSEWYIGGYGENSDWNSSTPWCACFVSWALEQCGGYIQGETPRYANVDTFCTDLVTSGDWKKGNPCAGDLIFFDWSADGDYNPEHIGVVIGSDDSRVYTIEGNVNNAVVLCSYELDDARILGYGLVNWAK